jgi:hypothetical protein
MTTNKIDVKTVNTPEGNKVWVFINLQEKKLSKARTVKRRP